jgi:Helitron helicase-like domain at N-terminus
MPGMFLTLFPFGIGGFDIAVRAPKLSFEAHVSALLNVPEKCFCRHHSFIFVALNIMQRKLSHLHTHFIVCKSNFEAIATKLMAVTPNVLMHLANHLEHEGSLTDLNAEEKNTMQLLKHVNTVSARIPGSQAAKIYTQNEICSYFGEFGLPQLYFTFNPSVTHFPIFQVMVGEQAVDLTKQFPFIVLSKDRALTVAEDPVAAADFFEFCVSSVFKYLFVWDFKTRKSKESGGILGHLHAFYGTCEFME